MAFFLWLDHLGFEQLVQFVVIFRAVKTVLVKEKEQAFQGQYLVLQAVGMIQACQKEISK